MATWANHRICQSRLS